MRTFMISALVFALLPSIALAQSRTWVGASPGAYLSPFNWFPNDVPDSFSEAALFPGGTRTVELPTSGAINVALLQVQGGETTVLPVDATSGVDSSSYLAQTLSVLDGATFVIGDINEFAAPDAVNFVGQATVVQENAELQLGYGSSLSGLLNVFGSMQMGSTFSEGERPVLNAFSTMLFDGGSLSGWGEFNTNGFTLTATNGANIDLTNIDFGNWTNGNIIIHDGSRIDARALRIGSSTAQDPPDVVTVGGTGEPTLDVATDLYLGWHDSSRGPGQLNIGPGGVAVVGSAGGAFDGDVRINAGSVINITSQGEDLGRLELSRLEIDGGTLNADGDLDFAFDSELTIVNGGTLTTTDGFRISQDVEIVDGVLETTGHFARPIYADSQRSLVVEGPTASLTTGEHSQFVFFLDKQTVFRHGAQASFAGLDVLSFNSPSTTHVLSIESDADVEITSSSLLIAMSFGAGAGSEMIVRVEGNGSTLRSNVATLEIGIESMYRSDHDSRLEVLNGGLLDWSGNTELRANGTLYIDGGTALLDSIEDLGGRIEFVSGKLSTSESLLLGTGGMLETSSLTLASTDNLTTTQDFTIDSGRFLILDGGTLSAGSLVNNGTFDFIRGTLEITGSSELAIGSNGPLGDRVLLQNSQRIRLTQRSLVVAEGGELILDGPAAEIEAPGVLIIGTLRGGGLLDAGFSAAFGAEVRVGVGDVLEITQNADIGSALVSLQSGELSVGQTLSNSIAGDIVGRGTLRAQDGTINTGDVALSGGVSDIFGDFSNESTGRVIISGSADVTFWDDVTHTGSMFRVSTGSSATFFGNAGFSISGGGTVNMEADITPGSSPGLSTFGGDVRLGSGARLEIEIGGTTRGSEYDSLAIDGEALLAGELDVVLLSEFTPLVNDSFTVLTAAGGLANSEFDTLSLPGLDLGLSWEIDYRANAVVLTVAPELAGDYNGDGVVDAADYTVFRDLLGATGTGLAADGNRDGQVTSLDYDVWRSNFGATLAASNIIRGAVPEPNTLLLVGLAATILLATRRRANERRCSTSTDELTAGCSANPI